MSGIQFPTTGGTEAGRWAPDGTGNGTHVVSGGAAAAPAAGAALGTGQYTLKVYITACNIKKLDTKFYGITKPRCHVIVKLGDDSYTTKDLPGLDPEWEEEVIFKISDPATQKISAVFYACDNQLGDEQFYALDKLLKGLQTYKACVVPGGKADMMFTAVDFGDETAPDDDDSFMDFL